MDAGAERDVISRWPLEDDAPGLRASALSTRGRVLLAAGAATDAAVALRAAVARWTELGVPYEAATARMLLGETHRLSGDDAAAAVAFAAARQQFDSLGVRDATPSLPVPSSALPCGLTEREAEVLRHVVGGQTNKEIAAALFLSEKTVARHMSNIFTKIGVPTRAAATAFAFERGLVGRPSS